MELKLFEDLLESLPEDIKQESIIVRDENRMPLYIQTTQNRRLRPWPFAIEQGFDKFCAIGSGLPHIDCCHFEVWHEGGGWDIPKLLFLTSDKTKIYQFCSDYDLINSEDRKAIFNLVKSLTTKNNTEK